ncbi:permease [Staphylococcus piscifermentans]|uniref:MFS transporter n=1 Tax=Staphylococcus piscifermentans TaxID=70258 RepID=A0A239TGJ7_9STAP|nr:MFS transporter [Staphylococcus piscifermentans]GEP83588.1 MFS transporter [Staphylococcus piscifermentans]SNU96629.1 permease [Staphylococcus piscifermentans]
MNIRSINLLLFEVISSIGSKIFSFACAFYILQHTETASIYSIYLALIVISSIISQPLFGIWTDKYNNKKIIIISQIINITALILFIPLFNTYFYYIIVLGIILNLTDGAISLIVNANIKNISQDDMERFVSLRQTYSSGISFLAPIIGGVLIAFISIQYLALLNVLTESISILFIFFLTMDRVMVTSEKSLTEDFKEGFSYLFKNKILLKFISIALIINFLINSIVVGIPVISIQTMKLSSQQFGIVESSFTVGMFAVSLLFSVFPIKNKLKAPTQAAIGIQFIGVLTLGLALLFNLTSTTGFIILFVIYFVIGVSLPLVNIPYSIYMQNYIEENYKGRVFSLTQSIVQTLTPLSLLVFGLLLNYSQSAVYLSVAILILLTLIYFSLSMKQSEIDN